MINNNYYYYGAFFLCVDANWKIYRVKRWSRLYAAVEPE